MTELGTILAVVVGGAMTLLGTLLANYLRYRAEVGERKRERLRGRLEEVRGYLISSLEFADLVSMPASLGPDEFGTGQYDEWVELVREHFETKKSLRAVGSARGLFSRDKDLLGLLRDIGAVDVQFWLHYRDFTSTGKLLAAEELEKERGNLRELAEKAQRRIDDLVDKA